MNRMNPMNRMNRMNRMIPVLGLFGVAITSTTLADAPQSAERLLHRRDGAAPLVVERVAATADGVQATVISSGLPREQLVEWERIAEIDPGPRGILEPGVEKGIANGTLLWRGRTRLERGDARLARAAFEAAIEAQASFRTRAASMALEGLVRSSIALGKSDEVLGEAALLAEFGAVDDAPFRFEQFGALVDPETGLLTAVPPIGGAEDLSRMLEWFRRVPTTDASQASRRNLLSRLMARSGPPEERPETLGAGDRLLFHLTELDADDSAIRERARRHLLEGIRDFPRWKASWVRFFIGRAALAHDADPDRRMRGVLDLVHVLAFETAAPPVLRRESLRLAVTALRELGREESAATLESIMFAEHPDGLLPETTP
jgi:hypothetical protein